MVAVGRLRPPFADDIAHYSKLIAGHARLELIEVREDERVERRIPERCFVSLLDDKGEAMDSVRFSRFLAGTPTLVAAINIVVAGALAALISQALGASAASVVVVGVIVAGAMSMVFFALAYRAVMDMRRTHRPLFPI